jgi:hypothetical protein
MLRARRLGTAVNLRLEGADGDSRPGISWVGEASGGRSFAFAVPLRALPLADTEGIHMVAEVGDRDGKAVQQLPPGGSIAVRPAREAGSHATRPLKILLVSAEVSPFAKVGGLADVAGALPKALRALGHDVRVVMPRYGSIDPDKHRLRRVLTALPVPLAGQPVPADIYEGRIGSDIPVYLIDNEGFFGREGLYGFWDDDARFVYFSRAALELLKPFLETALSAVAVDAHETSLGLNGSAALWATAASISAMRRSNSLVSRHLAMTESTDANL